MNPIDTIIQRLGYHNSDKLFYIEDIGRCADLTTHEKRVLFELSPHAVYMVDGRAFVLFFDDIQDRIDSDIHRKLWNAQIPVIISDEGNCIKIYNGKSMTLSDNKRIRLKDICTYNPEACDEFCDFSYWNVTNQKTLRLYETNLSEKNLNEFLIDNLRYIIKILTDKYHVSFASKLMLRVLFIRYLIDRGINIGYGDLNGDVQHSQEAFLAIILDKGRFFDLLRYLKSKFNGNLFEMDEQLERDELTDEALAVLHDFLTAKEKLKTGQLCLFPFYDFNLIPIELISNIYEILLGTKKREADMAFYTPEFLADYMVSRTVKNYLINGDECRILDPACGSGIFLVKGLREILERHTDKNGYIEDKGMINRLVQNNIFGADYNEEAVDVTIFSIYVTLFDYQNPKDLDNFKLPLLKNKNILVGDFFDQAKMKPLENQRFNFILGNPPWGKLEQSNYKNYCRDRDIKLPDGEISGAFLSKVLEMGDEDTVCSMVIPSKMLYKRKTPSVSFRENLLKDIQLNQVLELSAVRKQIFKGATAPAAVLSFQCQKSLTGHKVEHISVKPNKYLRLFGILMIEPNDVKYVEQTLLLHDDGLWKTLVYGGFWDYMLIRNLYDAYESVKDVAENHNLLMRKGLQENEGDKKDSSHLIGKKILDSQNAIDHFSIDEYAYTIFDKDKIHRPREAEIFKAPYVLFKKGLDSKDYSVRAVYVEKDFLYRETVNCIKGTENDKKVLLNLCGLLNSSLFSYLNLMCGSSVGIEREQIFLDEVENYPYAYSEKLADLVEQLQRGDGDREVLRGAVNDTVMEMFGLQGDYFIDYALSVQIPLLRESYQERLCTIETLEKYASVLSDVWNQHFGGGEVYHSIKIYPNINGRYAAVQINLSLEETEEEIVVAESEEEEVEQFTYLIIYQLHDCFYQVKNVAEFSENSYIIVKSAESRNWHPAVAVSDGYDIINTLLLGEEDGQ